LGHLRYHRGMRTLASVLLAFLLVPSVVLAQAPPQGQAPAQQAEATPAPTTSPYMTKVQNGLRLAVGRDFDGALASLREAVGLDSAKPEAHYYIGEVQRMRGNLDDALGSFRTAAQNAQSTQQPGWRARAMQAIAETLERQPDKLADAREAWTAYARFADANREAASPEIARARIQAIDVVSEQEIAYVAVRERIAARERENAQAPQRQGQRRNQ